MNKILKIIDRVILILSSIIFIILVGCISVLPIAKSKSYYMKEHQKNNVKEILENYTFNGKLHQHYDDETQSYYNCYWPKYDVKNEDILNATTHIIDYLYNSNTESMQFQIVTDEGKINFFSEQAILHMKDVKVLFIGGIKLCYICIVLFIAFIIYLIFRRKHIIPIFAKTYLTVVTIFIILGILITLFAMIDFSFAFEIFHKIIFPNHSKVKLALSFTYCDTLTNILTSNFFMHIGLVIVITFISILVLSIIVCLLIQKYNCLFTINWKKSRFKIKSI